MLITIGAGILGINSRFTSQIREQKSPCWILRPTRGGQYPAGTEFYTGDVRNREQIRAAMEKAQPRWGIYGNATLPLWKPDDIFSNAEPLIHSYQRYMEHALGSEVGVGTTHRVVWEGGALKVFK